MKAYVCDVCEKQAAFVQPDYRLPEGWYQVRTAEYVERHVCSAGCAKQQLDKFEDEAAEKRQLLRQRQAREAVDVG